MEADGRITSIAFESLTRATGFRKLSKKIDAEEMAAETARLVQVDRRILEEEDAKREEMKFRGERIKGLKADQSEILETIGTGERVTEVQVEEGFDWTAGKKYVRRLDTQEILAPEEIPEIERQMMLAGIEPAQFADKVDEFSDSLEDQTEGEPIDLSEEDPELPAEDFVSDDPNDEAEDAENEEAHDRMTTLLTGESVKNEAGEQLTCIKCGGFLKREYRDAGICRDCAPAVAPKKRGKKAGF